MQNQPTEILQYPWLEGKLLDYDDLRGVRESLGLTQGEFWNPVYVQQTTGSRYENSRDVPQPVAELLRIRYSEGIDPTAIRRTHVLVAENLRVEAPALYLHMLGEPRNHMPSDVDMASMLATLQAITQTLDTQGDTNVTRILLDKLRRDLLDSAARMAR